MTSHPNPTNSNDAKTAFVYQEALRGLLQQQSALESLRNRAGTLIFAASFASSLLGSKALDNGLGLWDWAAIGLMFGIGALTVVLLWPYYNLTFRFDPKDLLERYVDDQPDIPMAAMQKDLALRAREEGHKNGRIVRRLRHAFELSLALLMLEILAWIIAIAA